MLLAGIGYFALGRGNEPEATPLEGALAIAHDPSRFATSSTAADSFAAIATLLLAETQRCAEEDGPPTPPCLAVSQATAVAESAAVLAQRCPSDRLAGMRISLRTYLSTISRPIPSERDLPAVPRLPSCS